MKALRHGIEPDDGRALAALARRTRFSFRDDEIRVDGRTVGDAIRKPEVSEIVSKVAAHQALRRELVRRQREVIGSGGVVVEGRDIGTVVCPDADLKVFLTASASERARRRHRELSTKGMRVSLGSLRRAQKQRDALDSSRPVSPLVPANDAILMDSTGRTPRQVVAEIVRLARARARARAGARVRAGGGPRRSPRKAKKGSAGAARRR